MLNKGSRAKQALDEKDRRVRDWKMISGVLVGLMIIQGMMTLARQNDITVHIPPDLSNGATMKAGYIPKASVYLFASEVWRSINYWEQDGDIDMPRNLQQYQCYLSDRARQAQQDIQEVRKSQGQSTGRTRRMTEITDLKNVEAAVVSVGSGTWDVDLDLRLIESVQNAQVKDEMLRYRIRVAADNSGSTCNPFNMRIVGVNQPRKIEFVSSNEGGQS